MSDPIRVGMDLDEQFPLSHEARRKFEKAKPEELSTLAGTGAVRSRDADNERYDLISPIGLKAVAETCHEGAVKYSDFNWEKGFPIGSLLNHAIRHIYKYLEGDRSEPHLAHAAWNLLASIHSEKLWPHLNEGTLRGPGCTPPESKS